MSFYASTNEKSWLPSSKAIRISCLARLFVVIVFTCVAREGSQNLLRFCVVFIVLNGLIWRPWFSGRIADCGSADPSSILGGRPFLIDAGGTPAYAITSKKYEKLLQKIDKENVILILDTFDLSRKERTISVNSAKIKFQIEVKDVNLSADAVPAPKSYVVNGEISPELKTYLNLLINNCKTLREFMNSLIKYVAKDLKTCLLEDVLASIKERVKKIVEKTQITARAVCPVCNKFNKIILREKTCCGADVLETGRYVPQDGYLRPFLLLAGIIPAISDKDALTLFINRCEELGIEPKYVMINNKNAEGEV